MTVHPPDAIPHGVIREAAPRGSGIRMVVRPATPAGWWARWRHQIACGRKAGHCFHAYGFIGWFCCMCGRDVDGWPPDGCRHCRPRPS